MTDVAPETEVAQLTPLQMQQALLIMKAEMVEIYTRVSEIVEVLVPIAGVVHQAVKIAQQSQPAPTGPVSSESFRPGTYL